MKDYIRRSAKFIIYIVFLFFLILGVFPLLFQGRPVSDSLRDLLQNNRFSLMFGLLVAYGLVYPMITFVKIKRHLNGPFSDNREKFEKAFEMLDYIKISETPERIVYRKKSKFSRLAQWNEDEITVLTTDPVEISGFRKMVTRLDKIIDQLLLKESE